MRPPLADVSKVLTSRPRNFRLAQEAQVAEQAERDREDLVKGMATEELEVVPTRDRALV